MHNGSDTPASIDVNLIVMGDFADDELPLPSFLEVFGDGHPDMILVRPYGEYIGSYPNVFVYTGRYQTTRLLPEGVSLISGLGFGEVTSLLAGLRSTRWKLSYLTCIG